jgi:glycosyltransferase involved in cell wall biosynthesis
LGVLKNLRPSVVIVCGFSIPMIVAYLWAYFNGSKIISFTDGTLESESHLSFIHKLVRKLFYKLSFNCIGASKKSMDLIFHYRRRDGIFQSKLSIDTINFSGAIRPLAIRTYDLILCGQMIDTKMFKFSLSVIAKVNTLHSPLKVIILGDGVDREPILEFAKSLNIDFSYQGFVQQEDLFKHYVNSKIFLFPSKSEPWGIVANEACACGTPVITTPNTGCSGELIIDNYNGYVLNPDVELWASKIKYLLDNENVLQKFSDNCLHQSALFTQQESADGIIDAIKYAISAK